MKYLKKSYLLLGLIIFLAATFRFWHLGDVPIGFHRDEAFLGYNAYSILNTGKDASGNFLPLHFASFLYSPAGYSYFAIPFIKLFGLTEFAVRLPSALFGTLTVFVTYFLTKKIFSTYELPRIKKRINTNQLALVSAFLLAISPWHINLSRTVTENVIVVFFVSLGVALWLTWLKKKNLKLLFAAFFSFLLTLVIYQAPRAFLPFFIPLFIFLFYRRVQKKEIVLTVFLFFATVLTPLFFVLSSDTLSVRLRMLSIFSPEQRTKLVLTEQIHADGVQAVPAFIARVFHNKPVGYTHQFLQNYFGHFSYDFLFSDGGFPDRYRIPYSGLLYIFELPLLLFGIWKMGYKAPKLAAFLGGWVIIAPIGTALTFDDIPNLQRTINVFPALSLIAAFGFIEFLQAISLRRLKFFFLILSAGIILYSVSYYLHQYYIHGPVYRPWYRSDGYKELVRRIEKLSPEYKKVVVTSRETAPSIFFLFFTSYNPVVFQKETKGKNLKDFGLVGFGKYEFSQEECPLKDGFNQKKELKLLGEKGVLYVNSGLCSVPTDAQLLEEIRRKETSVVFHLLIVK